MTLKEIKEIKELWKLFPRTIKVRIIPCEEGGYCAKVLEPESLVGVITEGETLLELTEMINDAIYCVLDIPEKYYSSMVVYRESQGLTKGLGSDTIKLYHYDSPHL